MASPPRVGQLAHGRARTRHERRRCVTTCPSDVFCRRASVEWSARQLHYVGCPSVDPVGKLRAHTRLKWPHAPRAKSIAQIAVDETYVYVVGEQGLSRIPKSGGAAELVEKGTIADLAVDKSCLYWADKHQRAIFVAKK
jgi:hypothetical protein